MLDAWTADEPPRLMRQRLRDALMALLQISEPDAPAAREPRLAVGIDLGTTNSLVATVRNRIPVVLPDENGHPLLPSIVRYGEKSVDVGYAAQAMQARDPRNTIVSVKRMMGRGLADLPDARRFPVPLHRRAGHGEARDARGREEPGRNLGRHPARAAHSRRGEPRGQARGRSRHGAGLFRRRAAAGDQGRREARGPQRAAAPERADGGGDRLRPRQRGAGHVRDLRSRRRHVRHLDPEAHARRVRGARDERRFGARRRRLRSSRPLLDPRGGRACRRCPPEDTRAPDGEGARGEGEPDAASVDDRSTRRCPTAPRSSSRSTSRRSPRSRRISWRRRSGR